jgi:hypothetical protein
MVIDLSEPMSDPAFRVNSVIVGGEACFLICLHDPSAVVWTPDNLKFRSSLWNSKGELISASFPKFFNWDEQPHLDPAPKSIDGITTIMEKLDGSTLIVSKYKGHLIVRTRGTTDASVLDKNGFEIEILKKKYPKAFDFGNMDTSGHTRIFEWVSPRNRIVIPYEECDIYLTAIISHDDYSLNEQMILDNVAEAFEVKRPKRFVFSSLIQLKNTVANFIGVEGVCCYYNNDQSIRKLKGDEYLIRHKAKEKFQTIRSLLDFFVLENQPHLEVFLDKIEKEADYEVASKCVDDANCLIDSMTLVTEWMWNAQLFVEMVRIDTDTQKEAAAEITSRYPDKTFQGLAFMLYQNKAIPPIMLLRLINKARESIVTIQPA